MTDISIRRDGLNLAASVHGSRDAQPILLLHGHSLSRDTWDEIARRLCDCHQVWTLDFHGHGHSDHAPSYQFADYVADAEAMLRVLAKPPVVVGHSLGACVAGVLAQSPHLNLRGAFLEDPPWFLGEETEWQRSVFPKLFPIVAAQQASLQQENAPLAAYVAFVSNAPSPKGGVASDHIGPRQLLSHASALQRQDNRCWASIGSLLAPIPTNGEFRCPTRILQADPGLGAALLDGHEARLARANPRAEIVRYSGAGHGIHRERAFEEKFFADLMTFLSAIPA